MTITETFTINSEQKKKLEIDAVTFNDKKLSNTLNYIQIICACK